MHTPFTPAVSASASLAIGTAGSASAFHRVPITMAPATLDPQDIKKLKDSSVQLEATFTSFMMDELNKGLPGSEGDFGSQVYSDMFKQAISTKLAESGSGKGLSDQIFKASEKSALAHGGSRHLASAADAVVMGVSNDKSAMAYKAISATAASPSSPL